MIELLLTVRWTFLLEFFSLAHWIYDGLALRFNCLHGLESVWGRVNLQLKLVFDDNLQSFKVKAVILDHEHWAFLASAHKFSADLALVLGELQTFLQRKCPVPELRLYPFRAFKLMLVAFNICTYSPSLTGDQSLPSFGLPDLLVNLWNKRIGLQDTHNLRSGGLLLHFVFFLFDHLERYFISKLLRFRFN